MGTVKVCAPNCRAARICLDRTATTESAQSVAQNWAKASLVSHASYHKEIKLTRGTLIASYWSKKTKAGVPIDGQKRRGGRKRKPKIMKDDEIGENGKEGKKMRFRKYKLIFHPVGTPNFDDGFGALIFKNSKIFVAPDESDQSSHGDADYKKPSRRKFPAFEMRTRKAKLPNFALLGTNSWVWGSEDNDDLSPARKKRRGLSTESAQ